MILGIGTDIIEKNRIKNPEKLAKRILTTHEYKIFQSKKDKISFIAKKWAAKEAVSKAFGCGIGKALSFQDFEILNYSNGAPYVSLLKPTIITQNCTFKSNEIKINISQSDCKNIASSIAVVEGV